MAIDIAEFTSVSISVAPTGVSGGNFGILGFLTNEEGIVSAERTRSYTSLPGVAEDWSATSEVYKAATAFYSQTPRPRDFTVIASYDVAQPAALLGGGSDTPEELVSITAGNLALTIDSSPVLLTGLDFSGINSYDDVADVIQSSLMSGGSSATTTHNGYSFVIVSGTTGSTQSNISFATSDNGLSEALGFEQHQARISDGLDAEVPTESLAVASTLGTDITALVLHKDMRDISNGVSGTNTADIADWCEASKVLFMNTTNDLTTLVATSTTDIASQMKNKSLQYTLTTFSKNKNEYVSASVFGRAASVNFEGVGTTITLNLKQMPTVTVEDLTAGEFAALRGKFASAVVKIGATVNAYTDSRMASGTWLDTTHGIMWLSNRCEVDMFNLLYQSTTKIPFTQYGINLSVARLERSLEAAVVNGLAAPGFLPDGRYLPNGYEVLSVPLGDVPSGDKSNRIYKGLTFNIVGAGALHEVHVTGSFAE